MYHVGGGGGGIKYLYLYNYIFIELYKLYFFCWEVVIPSVENLYVYFYF